MPPWALMPCAVARAARPGLYVPCVYENPATLIAIVTIGNIAGHSRLSRTAIKIPGATMVLARVAWRHSR